MKKIYITGAPGTGKSTIVNELNKRNIFAFDIDAVEELAFWKSKTTHQEADYHSGVDRSWLEQHEFICDVEKLKKLINVDRDIVAAAGISDNQNEYLHLFNHVFLLQCKKETFLKRLSARTGEDEFGQTKDEQEYVVGFYKDFEKDLIDRGALPIDVENPVDVVVNEIISKI